jgi:hypothetical protein
MFPRRTYRLVVALPSNSAAAAATGLVRDLSTTPKKPPSPPRKLKLSTALSVRPDKPLVPETSFALISVDRPLFPNIGLQVQVESSSKQSADAIKVGRARWPRVRARAGG